MSDEILYICVGGCGDFKLSEMKVHTDGTLICPNCGNCQWYLTPKEIAKELILLDEVIYDCPFCNGKGWDWYLPDDIPLSMMPTGNYARSGLEVKSKCIHCNGTGKIKKDNPWYDAIKRNKTM